MNDRFAPIPVGKVLPPPTRIPAPAPLPLDDARAQPDHEAMDDVGAYAEQQRADKRSSSNLIDILHALPVERLITEARALQARMLGSQFSAHDFALVVAMTRRIERHAVPVRGKEALDGALWLDLGRAA